MMENTGALAGAWAGTLVGAGALVGARGGGGRTAVIVASFTVPEVEPLTVFLTHPDGCFKKQRFLKCVHAPQPFVSLHSLQHAAWDDTPFFSVKVRPSKEML